MTTTNEIAAEFEHRFGVGPRLFRAPGRVNLIGEHTDYNEGFVLPAALDLATVVAIAPRDDRRLVAHSAAFDATAEHDLDAKEPRPRKDWSDYIVGVAVMLERAGHRLVGADMLVAGDMPIGAGLSSSAALEVAVGYALLALSGVSVDPRELARCCQRAENEFVGMRCGIMDQLIACCAVPGHALLIDCRSLATRPIRIDPCVRLVICNTMVRHELGGSEYNRRRHECEQAAALLSGRIAGVNSLRDVSSAQLEAHAALLPEVTFRRARHVVSENARVLAAAAALDSGDLAQCGRLMNESHTSLRDDYEVSCPELDLMVDLAQGAPGVFGSRMTGGGFGGSTVSLVEEGAIDRFTRTVGEAYREATGKVPSIFACAPGSGVGPVPK